MVFGRILVGVDGSEASLDALGRARRLLAEGGTLTAVIVNDEGAAAQAGFAAVHAAGQLEARAEEARQRAAAELEGLPEASVRVVRGRPLPTLLELARETEADLIALGSHEHRRAAGLALGSVASRLVHDAPVSVLLARAGRDPKGFPRRIVAGTDGSEAAQAAVETASDLARRLGAELRVVTAAGGKHVDEAGLEPVDDVERDERAPVNALIDSAADADLLVVGSRGLHGVSSLGSVSERVAHRAACSVLVVR